MAELGLVPTTQTGIPVVIAEFWVEVILVGVRAGE